ncbi:MAG: hypothetical protein ACR2N3_03560 [Pyrinomonadaceae bacterium]
MKKNLGLFLCLVVISLSIACQPASKEASENASNDAPAEKKFDVVGGNWLIKFPPPTDGSSPKNLEFRLLKDTNHPTLAEDVTADATAMELSSAAGFPANGKIYTYNGETIGYTSISGNTLQGLNRGQDGSAPQSHTKGQAVYLITMQRELGDKTEYQMPQLPDDYYVHYRWQTGSKENGDNGWGNFEMAGFAPGSASSAPPK